MGRGADFKSSFAHKGFVAFCLRVHPPTSVGFAAHAADGRPAAKRPCSPKTSLVADATNGFTHGRVQIFFENIFDSAVRRKYFAIDFTVRFSPEVPKLNFEVCNTAATRRSDPMANCRMRLHCNFDLQPIPPGT